MRPTAVYRLFDHSGALLYVGVAFDPDARFKQHKRTKSWWPEVDHARTLIVWFDNRDEAESVELASIREELPVHNVVVSDENGCARFLPRQGGASWGRPAWAPPNSSVAADITRTVLLHRRWKAAEQSYKASLRENYDPAGDNVPVAYLAKELGAERKTVYRHLGQTMS